MPTVVDSLVVELGLDSSTFTAGFKQILEDLRKLQSNTLTVGKEVESSGKRAASFFSSVRTQALLMFAAFTGGKGIKQFVSDITAGDAALGRFAVVAGTTTQELSKWRGIANATGGSADGVAQSINGLNQSLVKLSLTGESEVIPYLRALQAFAPQVNLSLQDANGNMRTAIDMLPALHQAVQRMEAAKATAILSGMGLGQDLVNILISSDKAFNKFMADQKRWGGVTKEQAAAAQRLQYTTAGVVQSFESLGRTILNKLTPGFVRFNEHLIDLADWFKKHPKEMEKALLGIIGVVTTLAVVLGGPLTAIAALALAVTVLYTDWESYNKTGTSTFEDFWKFVELGWQSITTLIDMGTNAFQRWVKAITGYDISGFKLSLSELGDIFVKVFAKANTDLLDWIDSIGNIWNNFWTGDIIKAILDSGPAIFTAVKKVFGEAFDWAIKKANIVWNVLTGHNLIGGETEADAASKAELDRRAANGIGGGALGGGIAAGLPKRASRAQQEEDIQDFIKKGWSREDAAAIVGNFLAESSGDSSIHQVGGGGGYGLAQWTDSSRKANFKRLYGKDITESTREEQRSFADWELRNTHKAAGDNLRNAQGVQAKSDVVLNQYEQPAERVQNSQLRGAYARALMTPPPVAPLPGQTGAPLSAINLSSPATGNSSTATTDINIKEIHINTQATDAVGISKSVEGALNDRFSASMSNSGQI